jgi:hypothetical protein
MLDRQHLATSQCGESSSSVKLYTSSKQSTTFHQLCLLTSQNAIKQYYTDIILFDDRQQQGNARKDTLHDMYWEKSQCMCDRTMRTHMAARICSTRNYSYNYAHGIYPVTEMTLRLFERPDNLSSLTDIEGYVTSR